MTAVSFLSRVMALIASPLRILFPQPKAVLSKKFLILKLIPEPVLWGFVLNINITEGERLG